MKQSKNLSWTSLFLVAVTLGLSGCKVPIQEREVAESGFLRDYSKLKPGEEGASRLVYISRKADFAKYNKILMDPITIWAVEDSTLTQIPEEERLELVNYLAAAIRENLKGDYEFVPRPGRGVMRLRIAITEGREAHVVMNTISSVGPVSLTIDLIKFAATGTHMAVGETMVEIEVIDSVSMNRLAAAVDARSGRKSLISGNFTEWGDVEDAYDFWAKKLRLRLSELRTQ
jgi:hypothetical protein